MNNMNSMSHSDSYMARSPASYSAAELGKSKSSQFPHSPEVYDDYGAQEFVNGPPNGVPRKFLSCFFLSTLITLLKWSPDLLPKQLLM